ncbi:MAG: SMP-30/gluconolactonase/LRE family protein [Candidatus Microsaccharimonas sp.]
MQYRKGFTIVELLIVIVVIAILAAVVIVGYNGITKQARQSSLLSDVSNAATIMGTDQAQNGTYALTASSARGGSGIPSSEGTSFSFHSSGSTYCITARSSHSGVDSYFVSSDNPTPTKGECAQDGAVAVETVAGNGTLGAASGTGTAATLAGPAGLTADSSGDLYFTDQQGSRIRKMTTSGVVTNLFGNGPTGNTEGVGTAALFNWPQAVTVGPGNVLYVADTNSHRIRIAPINGSTTSLFAGSSQGLGGAIGASGAAVQLNTPRGIVYNPVTATVYVADSQNNRIRVFDTTGKLLLNIGSTTGAWADGTSTTARFNFPQGLTVDSSGNVYVADTQNHRIRMIDTSGNVTTVAGSGTAGLSDNTTGTSAQFRSPSALTVSTNGTIYVADTLNNAIRKITPDRTVTTIAGNGTAGFADESGADARFNEPKGIAIGSDGRLYIADRANHRIRTLNIF